MRTVVGACILILLTSATLSHAALVTWDLLGGVGNFEKSTEIRWISGYTGSDYDFAANNGYVYPYTTGNRTGYKWPTADDTVAVGWFRESNENVNPATNMVYRLVDGAGLNSSKAQYLAIKGVRTNRALIRLKSGFRVDASNENLIHPGDTLTFRIDHIRMSQYSGLPDGSWISYRMSIADTGISDSTGYSTKVLSPSSTAFAGEVTYTVPAGVSSLNVLITIETSGDIGSNQPGIYIDGAHLYVKRAGSSSRETREVPVKRERNIRSHKLFFHSNKHDVYSTARDYDVVMFESVDGADFSAVYKLKYLNPDIKVLLYQSGGCIWDVRDSNGKDLWRMGAPFGMDEVLRDYVGWLYPNNVGGYVNLVKIPTHYLARIADSNYQRLWADRVIEVATRFGFDGVFVDDLGTRVSALDGSKLISADIAVWEVQRFIHSTFTRMRAAGLEIVRNAGTMHLISGDSQWWFDQLQGKVYFDPHWQLTDPYTDPTKYQANTPDKVGDGALQEWSFWKLSSTSSSSYGYGSNNYDQQYWLRCLEDMDAVRQWNTATGSLALTADQKKFMHFYVLGVDTADDPAAGTEGWLQFALCSYLLAQNEWTTLGYALGTVSVPGISDFSIAKRLGTPDGTHLPYLNDTYLRYRFYKTTESGGVGGVVVVNGNTDVSKTYRLPFEAVDESGGKIASGALVTLKPNTGRVFFRSSSQVAVQVSTSSETVTPGQEITVTVEYSNISGAEISNFTLKARVPDETTYISGSAESSGGRYDWLQGMVIWQFQRLAVGESGTKTFKARVK